MTLFRQIYFFPYDNVIQIQNFTKFVCFRIFLLKKFKFDFLLADHLVHRHRQAVVRGPQVENRWPK